jgi:hypothetical protein
MTMPDQIKLGRWIAVKRGKRSVDVARGGGGVRFTMSCPGFPVDWLYDDARMVVAALNKTRSR